MRAAQHVIISSSFLIPIIKVFFDHITFDRLTFATSGSFGFKLFRQMASGEIVHGTGKKLAIF